MSHVVVHPELEHALRDHQPVVALESAVITAGLPSTPHALAPVAGVTNWNAAAPTNIEAARAMMHAVRESGAVPAITAIMDGHVHIGLPESELPALADKAGGAKATVRDFGVLIAKRGAAGTTVAGTLRACSLLGPNRIRVMATGGIGGVHHTWPSVPDVSADLLELARTPIAVVCSGAKSVLNLRATMEMLETFSVPVVGFQTDRLPAFYLREFGDLRCQSSFDSPSELAAMCRAHWTDAASSAGIVIAQPVTEAVALDANDFGAAIRAATSQTAATGADVTPALLRDIARLTGGKSLDANISLLVANARLAGHVAAALANMN